ncbi:hypothetical protein M427DRAFT_68715 [Gonapodya prolifera JEL478]|uniref:Uncharacterized protein n=1 Tax=Gonapodya prolifera (strain JEL478) TaxID=1344416 RepID=A0A139AJJ6_GONPJ|nr:hypothetical protein M427DRAFT_68715 [Gonapodya prolifera JEL478]|eukprot:KXS16952.1 hypothetical protein M427DRAFT_68715 [Gonapodya prolifera JEL478]
MPHRISADSDAAQRPNPQATPESPSADSGSLASDKQLRAISHSPTCGELKFDVDGDEDIGQHGDSSKSDAGSENGREDVLQSHPIPALRSSLPVEPNNLVSSHIPTSPESPNPTSSYFSFPYTDSDPADLTVMIEGRIFRRSDFEVESDFDKLLAIKELALTRPLDVEYTVLQSGANVRRRPAEFVGRPGTRPSRKRRATESTVGRAIWSRNGSDVDEDRPSRNQMKYIGGGGALFIEQPPQNSNPTISDPISCSPEEASSPPPLASRTDPRRTGRGRRPTRHWTLTEIRALELGLVLFGGSYGEYASTLRLFSRELAGRKNMDLKDKARNQMTQLVKAGARVEEVAPYLRGSQKAGKKGAMEVSYPPALIASHVDTLRATIMAHLHLSEEDLRRVAKGLPLGRELPPLDGVGDVLGGGHVGRFSAAGGAGRKRRREEDAVGEEEVQEEREEVDEGEPVDVDEEADDGEEEEEAVPGEGEVYEGDEGDSEEGE